MYNKRSPLGEALRQLKYAKTYYVLRQEKFEREQVKYSEKIARLAARYEQLKNEEQN